MSTVEADLLLEQLLKDPSSTLFAVYAGWEHPASREWVLLATIRDVLEATRLGSKARQHLKPWPRPWPDRSKKRIGSTTLSPADAVAVLRKARAGLLRAKSDPIKQR